MLSNAASAMVLGNASNTGTLSYTGNSASYTLCFTVNAGDCEIDTTSSGHTLTIATGTITYTLPLHDALPIYTTISSVISGSGALTKTGAGTLTLSGNNTYTGTTTIS